MALTPIQSVIKSVQRGSTNIPAAGNVAAQAITGVDLSKSVCSFLGISSGATTGGSGSANFTNSTTLSCTASVAGNVLWTVTEYV